MWPVVHAQAGNPPELPVQTTFVQASLFILLFGTIVGDFALLGDVGNRAVHSLWDTLPAFVDEDGRLVMVSTSPPLPPPALPCLFSKTGRACHMQLNYAS